jgi:hypothetical protein
MTQWKALVDTDGQLARVIGVTQPAIRKAELRGRITREPDGRWDVLAVVDDWRQHTRPLLQRHGRGQFHPWLDVEVPLVRSVWAELMKRADAAGAEWERG